MHISIIDDEKLLVGKIIKKLESNGYVASAFHGYRDFMTHGDAKSQLYIIDLSLGDGSGFDIIKWLRVNNNSCVPIIIISGFGDSQNIIFGLDLGADDYLIKPIVPEELMARIKALLRRPAHFVGATIISHRNISYDRENLKTKVGNKEVFLTKTESLLLEFFILNSQTMISRDKLITQVWWSHKSDISDNTINVTLSKVRKKIGKDFAPKCYYGQGYILE